MKHLKTWGLILSLFLAQIAVAQNTYPIIPAPLELKTLKGVFTFEKDTKIYFDTGVNAHMQNKFDILEQKLRQAAGISLQNTTEAKATNTIVCRINDKLDSGEAYKLSISSARIEIEAKSEAGFFYAAQSIRQLLSIEIESKTPVANTKWTVPNCNISDSPTFRYRGLHIDVCRHFSTVDEIKSHIDQMALLKINTFHWHLTDDQGWRIEIKKYPKLTQIGGARDKTLIGHHNDFPHKWDFSHQEGYYTQEEIKDVIDYATKRCINIIPEIEMPGHATAALAAYPEYSCSGGPFEVEGRWGVFNDVFCPTEDTFHFLEDVLDEVVALFPSQYIHIGGDECPKVRWTHCHACQERIKAEGLKDEHELQSYFVKRMERYLSAKGRRIIGWDEILDGGIAPNATVMSWRGIAGGIAAARQGHDVIMTPSTHMYLDFYQNRSVTEPLAIGGYTPVEKVYNYQAMPTELSTEEYKHILGIQANIWTEYMPNRQHREYMIYPRLAAVAEVAWLAENKKDYKRFSNNLHSLIKRYDVMGINHGNAFFGVTAECVRDVEEGLRVELKANNVPNGNIRYTLDGTQPNATSPIYTQAIPVSKERKTIKAVVEVAGKIISDTFDQEYIVNKAAGQRLTFSEPNGIYFEQNGTESFTDCMMGKMPLGRFDWFSYVGGDASITVQFDKPTEISSIALSTCNQNNVYVYSPKELMMEVSTDGENFSKVGSTYHDDMAAKNGLGKVQFARTTVKKIRINVHMYGILPKDKVGAGSIGSLFTDELIVE